MERLVRKYERGYRKAKEEIETWNGVQSLLVKQFSNAVAILERLPVLTNPANYGVLASDMSLRMIRDLPATQVETLESILRAMSNSLADLNKSQSSLEKICQNGLQLPKTERQQPTPQQLRLRVGPRPSLQDCMDGLYSLYKMHHDEYLLKVALVGSLSYDIKSEDAQLLLSLLEGEANIPADEVQHIFDLIFAGEK